MNTMKTRIKIFFLGIKIMFQTFFNSQSYDTITVCGDREFKHLTVETLNLLKNKNSKAYDMIKNHIAFICQDKSTCIFSYVKPTICLIKKEEIKNAGLYYAGILVHEAYHVFLHEEYLRQNPSVKDVPEKFYSGEEAERKCIEYARGVLPDVGFDITRLPSVEEMIETQWWRKQW